MKPKYTFYIQKQSSTTMTEVHPVWKDDLSLEYAMESQQMFFRTQLSGSVDLIRSDYDLVMAEPFGTVFYFDIYISNYDTGGTPVRYWHGKFTLADCKVNVDDKRITVKPEVVDQYTDILAGLEKEFDLIRLAPEIQAINVRKRPCLQILNIVGSTVACICGNQSFEQDASLPDSDIGAFLERCAFSAITTEVEIFFPNPPFGFEASFAEPFTGTLSASGDRLTNTYNAFYIEYTVQNVGGRYDQRLDIKNTSQDVTYWYWERAQQPYPLSLPSSITFEPGQTTLGQLEGETTDLGLYSRVVCNVDHYNGQPTVKLQADDVVTYNRNYQRAFAYDANDLIVTSSRVQTDPTPFGRRESDGKYYLPPTGTDGSGYIPIGRGLWKDDSVWLRKSNDYRSLDSDATDIYLLKDAFPLHSVLSRLLAQVAPSLTFSNTTTYSQFLYRQVNGQYKDPITDRDCRIYITPKSNMTAGEYQTPAQQAPVTLRDILNMLRDTYRLYWFVDTSGHLRIEHVWYFQNGGSYSGSPSVGVDLTTMENPRNGKAWSMGVNSYDFEKSEMPERYQFAWMDEVTEPFKGQPIEVLSPYIEKGRVDEINVSNFTSDIDLMLLNPSQISSEGFAVMNVTKAEAITGTLFGTYTQGSEGKVFDVAEFIQGKYCYFDMQISGDGGTLTLVWYYRGRYELSDSVFSVPRARQDWLLEVPDGVTAIGFRASETASVTIYSIRTMVGDEVQIPMLTISRGGESYTMQNGYLSFHMLQLPYWRYYMPARSLRVDGDAMQALSIMRLKKQTVSIPLALTDPDVQQLVKTGLGNGQIQQMSVRLTSRMAKIKLQYDAE